MDSHKRAVAPVLGRERAATMQLHIDLTRAIHACSLGNDGETDAGVALVCAAVLLGHAQGSPMNASQIGKCVGVPRTTVVRRLKALKVRGVIVSYRGRYYLEPGRAEHMPHSLNLFTEALHRAFAVLGPFIRK